MRRARVDPLTYSACVLDYLFRPLPSTRETIAAYSAILAHPDVLSVSIHVRTKDQAMHTEGALDLDAFLGVFTCAQKLLRRDPHNITHVVVHLASDYQPLRERFVADPMSLFSVNEWPLDLPKPWPLVTASRVRHSSLDSVFDLGRSAKTMQEAVLEQAIMDASDFRLTTEYSGFAQMSVLRTGLREASVLTMGRAAGPCDRINEIPVQKTAFCDDKRAALSNIQELRESWCCSL